MTNAEILSLAYQRQAEGAPGTLSDIIDQVKADLSAMDPTAPGPNEETGFKSELAGNVRTNYTIMGDGSMVEALK